MNDVTNWLSQTTDNSKYFVWSPGLQDKESRLYNTDILSMRKKRCHAKKNTFLNGCLSNLAVLYDMFIDSAYVGNSTCTTACAETIQYFAYTI